MICHLLARRKFGRSRPPTTDIEAGSCNHRTAAVCSHHHSRNKALIQLEINKAHKSVTGFSSDHALEFPAIAVALRFGVAV
eukprot:6217345-Amphidinium_carterae.1